MNKYRLAFNVEGKVNYITVDATYYVRQEGFVDFIRIKEMETMKKCFLSRSTTLSAF